MARDCDDGFFCSKMLEGCGIIGKDEKSRQRGWESISPV